MHDNVLINIRNDLEALNFFVLVPNIRNSTYKLYVQLGYIDHF